MNNYKILVLKNTSVDLTNDCNQAKDFFAKHGIPMTFSFQDCNIPIGYKVYLTRAGFNTQTGKPETINLYGLIDSVKDTCRTLVKEGTYDAVIFAYDIDALALPNGSPANFTNLLPLYPQTDFMQIMTDQYIENSGEIALAIKHELMHALCFRLNRFGAHVLDEMDVDHLNRSYYKNIFPDAPFSNFGETFTNMKPYISTDAFHLLDNNKTMYKYFKDSEVVGLKPEFVTLLNKACGIAGIPFKITSGFRSPSQNAAVGGVKDSAHETGLAVDLAVADSVSGGKILLALAQVGLNRFGFYTDGHIHVDYDLTKPNPCYWVTIK